MLHSWDGGGHPLRLLLFASPFRGSRNRELVNQCFPEWKTHPGGGRGQEVSRKAASYGAFAKLSASRIIYSSRSIFSVVPLGWVQLAELQFRVNFRSGLICFPLLLLQGCDEARESVTVCRFRLERSGTRERNGERNNEILLRLLLLCLEAVSRCSERSSQWARHFSASAPLREPPRERSPRPSGKAIGCRDASTKAVEL